MLRMILSRLEGKHASCRFSAAGATECDAVAFVTALLASQFMLLASRKRVLEPHDVALDSMRSMHHNFLFQKSRTILSFAQVKSTFFVLEFCGLIPQPACSCQPQALDQLRMC